MITSAASVPANPIGGNEYRRVTLLFVGVWAIAEESAKAVAIAVMRIVRIDIGTSAILNTKRHKPMRF